MSYTRVTHFTQAITLTYTRMITVIDPTLSDILTIAHMIYMTDDHPLLVHVRQTGARAPKAWDASSDARDSDYHLLSRGAERREPGSRAPVHPLATPCLFHPYE